MTIHTGLTTRNAFQKATGRLHHFSETKSVVRTSEVNALPIIWSGWIPLIAQFGGTPDATNIIDIRFRIPGRAVTAFEIEFRGGDFPVSAVGPGSARVEITGNAAAEISYRVRSFSVPVPVRVRAQLTRQVRR